LIELSSSREWALFRMSSKRILGGPSSKSIDPVVDWGESQDS
jgi:hypothetical protein